MDDYGFDLTNYQEKGIIEIIKEVIRDLEFEVGEKELTISIPPYLKRYKNENLVLKRIPLPNGDKN